jgi:hydrogenase maturation protein HypF
VGYRPFVYVTAHELGLAGSVLNASGKVFVHAQGATAALNKLEQALVHAAPPFAKPVLASSEPDQWRDIGDFAILSSDSLSDSSRDSEIHIPPDLFTCDDCLVELTSPSERRYQYPFINCTQCGPRYTLITAMPYDRPNTSMAGFPLCDDCRSEYENPLDRRFHAQPLACATCGPHLEFFPSERDQKTQDSGALDAAVAALQAGEIVAVKGVGGYHLMCDATNDESVRRLRERKFRPHKPLAVMFPLRGDDGLDALRQALLMDEMVERAVLDPARPIVLARKRKASSLSPEIAPNLQELGVFLPYSPLHHQILQHFDKPLVATSGNISGEPVITDNQEAEQRLSEVADAFLHHNRPIIRPADDAVVRPIAGAARLIRPGRGIAPIERELPFALELPTLAVGGHMKVTVALAWENRLVLSPHIGDLDSARSLQVFRKVIGDLQTLYDVQCQQIICDQHPGYASGRWAEQTGLPVQRVQHHAAHASALAGEHPEVESWLVFTWDGVGYGDDGSLWGGEALSGRPGNWKRVASFKPFRLLGGDRAGREPWRSAAALMWQENQQWLPTVTGAELARQAWDKDIGVFPTSAAGRLFDAAAALILGRHVCSFEGQGPMELEQMIEGQMAKGSAEPISLPLAPDDQGILRSDWAPLLPMLIDQSQAEAVRAELFHVSMAQTLADQAITLHKQVPFQAVGLSGGVFQNRRLTELVLDRLHDAGLDCRLHQDIPSNDGGLCFGQIMETAAAASRLKRESRT